ncbi:MAG: hypothetical protein IT419_15385 [Planctomycetes bacterium]|nr:hypothetical protein [Planctomycetota bacterium]
MTSGDPIVAAHSVAEAFFYLMAKRCHRCGTGPLKPAGGLTKTDRPEAPWRLSGRCPKCESDTVFHFLISPAPTREDAASSVVNATVEPSRAIDLLGWLTLFQTVLASADQAADRESKHDLLHEAGMCLDEALKFYGPGEELPGPDAFFNGETRQRFLDHPNQFTRSQWADRRAKLPISKREDDPPPKRKRWWQRKG